MVLETVFFSVLYRLSLSLCYTNGGPRTAIGLLDSDFLLKEIAN